MKEHIRRLQGTVEELEKKNYYLEQEGRVLRGIVRNYEDRYRILEGFALMIFIFRKLIVGLHLLGLF